MNGKIGQRERLMDAGCDLAPASLLVKVCLEQQLMSWELRGKLFIRRSCVNIVSVWVSGKPQTVLFIIVRCICWCYRKDAWPMRENKHWTVNKDKDAHSNWGIKKLNFSRFEYFVYVIWTVCLWIPMKLLIITALNPISRILKIKVFYWHQWFHEEPLKPWKISIP